MDKICVPPIKSQGIKTKLIPYIKEVLPKNMTGSWIEPFMGTGCVAFNVAPKKAILADTNPHLINFYNSIKNKEITPLIVKEFLQKEGKLLEKGEEHYYNVRERFNIDKNPLDFLFLNRACFNGMVRFNKKGGFNVPFCRKPERFAKAYITKIVNQVNKVQKIIDNNEYKFVCQDFKDTISMAEPNDLIYCDPPYIGRHVDYFNSWDEVFENELFQYLSKTNAKFILSTWHHNDFRKNEFIDLLWNKYNILTRNHFYHIGGHEENRNPMVEALITNYKVEIIESKDNLEEENLFSIMY